MAKKFETFTKETYEEPSLKNRKEIQASYIAIEDKVNDFYEKKISAKEFAEYLSSIALGIGGDHASAQIYAYENLIKSLSETNEPGDIKLITDEIFFGAAVERNPMKRAYLLGILHYYSSRDRLKQILDEESRGGPNERTRVEKDIVKKIRDAASSASKKTKDEEKITDYILGDFSQREDETNWARLISDYYRREPRATRMPSLGRKKLLNEDIWSDLEGNGLPRYVYALPQGYHPSTEKVDEADRFGLVLKPEAAFFEGDEKIYVEYDMNPELARLYNRRIRYYKNNEVWDRVRLLEESLRERIWREIQDDPGAREVFRNRGDITVVKKTIRDWPEDTDVRLLLEKDFREDTEEEKPAKIAS